MEDTPRAMEMEVVSSMYSEEELSINSEDPWSFTLGLELELEGIEEPCSTSLRCRLLSGHPHEAMEITIDCTTRPLKRAQHDLLRSALLASLSELEEEELRVRTTNQPEPWITEPTHSLADKVKNQLW